jgi:hypothetical protein
MKSLSKYSLSSLITALVIAFLFPELLIAQDSTSEKQKVYVTMKYINDNGKGKVDFKVFTKEGKKKEPVQFSIVNLYLNENSKLGMMGNITTDENGEGSVPLSKKFADQSDTLSEFTFIGSLMNDPRLADAEMELPIKKSTLELSLYEEDSVKYAKAILKEKNEEGEWIPVPEVEIGFFVQRYFSLLSVAEYPVSTDENGEAIFEFPEELKGDSVGDLHIVVKIDANDNYGTLIASSNKKWGVPVKNIISEERLLSGSRKNAPLTLVIISSTIVLAVWSVIVYIILQLFKIKSLHKQKQQSS